MSHSELQTNTQPCQARETDPCEQLTFGFGFTSCLVEKMARDSLNKHNTKPKQ